MARSYWLVKSEPEVYSWNDLVREGVGRWDGVRNYQARNHLRNMRVGDSVLIYHSVQDKAVVGIAEVKREAYADPTAKEGDWNAVDVSAVRPFSSHVTLEQIKKEPKLRNIGLVRQGRLSVMPLTKDEFDTIVRLGTIRGAK